MIKVNLLPIEKRKAESTPLPRFVAILGGVVVVLLMGVAAAFFWMQSSLLDKELTDLDGQIAEAKTKTAEKNSLEMKVKQQKARGDAIDSIEKSRQVLWAERLDRIAQVLDKQARKVWMTSIKGTDNPGGAAGGPAAGPGGGKAPVVEATLEVACKSTKDLDRGVQMGIVTAEFVESMTRLFIKDTKDFTRYDDRYQERTAEETGYVEGYSNEFTLKLFRDKPQAPPSTGPVAPK